MFETVVIATDGSESAQRAVRMAIDFADRFDACVHALYVVDETELQASPDEIKADLEQALEDAGGEALSFVRERTAAETANDCIVTAVREGEPTGEIISYAKECDADLIATGTRGRHGDHAFLLGSVAESVVRRSPFPVLTVRQLSEDEQQH